MSRPLQPGDRVRVRSLPPLEELAVEARAALELALGQELVVQDVGPYGHLELQLGPEADRRLGSFMNTIWLEAEHLERVRGE
ncbi:MAG TPA: hypothetical protein VFV62_03075 [Gaiellaceae bacterium]|nr:hypothetical protein [Gaiellaceae bacterium]